MTNTIIVICVVKTVMDWQQYLCINDCSCVPGMEHFMRLCWTQPLGAEEFHRITPLRFQRVLLKVAKIDKSIAPLPLQFFSLILMAGFCACNHCRRAADAETFASILELLPGHWHAPGLGLVGWGRVGQRSKDAQAEADRASDARNQLLWHEDNTHGQWRDAMHCLSKIAHLLWVFFSLSTPPPIMLDLQSAGHELDS